VDDVPCEAIDRQRDRLAPGIPRQYHAVGYFAASNAVAAVAIIGALIQLQHVRPWEWLIIPAAFLVANWVEYRVHKGPMHHLRPPWQILFERHTRQHHVYFDESHMSARNSREYYWVFFPWWAVGLVIGTAGLFALPLWFFASQNLSLLFFAVAISYYLTYEWLHLSYHLPPESFVGQMWLVQRLRRLHTMHHDTALMTTQNFNITFPICDWLYGTLGTRPDTVDGQVLTEK
jgi:hypothetical protein